MLPKNNKKEDSILESRGRKRKKERKKERSEYRIIMRF